MKTLKFTTTNSDMFVGVGGSLRYKPSTLSRIYSSKLLPARCYIHGEAEGVAGYDIPLFFDGDIEQLSLDIDKQDIVMCLEDKVYSMKAEYQNKGVDKGAIYLTFKNNQHELEDNGYYWLRYEGEVGIGKYDADNKLFKTVCEGWSVVLYHKELEIISDIILRETS